MSRKEAYVLPIAIPPLPEQRLIVAKVEELMALCDRLEAAQNKREQRRDRLNAASLNRINQPSPSADGEAATSFREYARFHLDQLPRLTTRHEHIKSLRQTILNLAVHGYLVPRNPNDEPASVLLTQIANMKGQPRRRTVTINPESAPYPLPSNWQWASLDQVITAGPQNGISPKPTTREDAPKAITLTATTSGTFNPTHFKRVEATIPDDSAFWLSEGDLLFQRGNTREYVGIAAIYDGPPNCFLFPDLIMKVRLSSLLNLRFIHLAAVSPPARTFLSENASGAQATMPKINQSTLVSLPIPIPPLAEQHRIVAKVDELMAVCDQLEAQLTATQTDSRRLLEAVLREALVPAEERELTTHRSRRPPTM
ncbi:MULTISPECIES: restriction endonuclease subunit S [unclassified Thiocapsa]|uniref:restriction endonuclease subunit S n=1 Tax=unclassified Thiocapsa TaxID=2641286 RepID=UPI0035AF1102